MADIPSPEEWANTQVYQSSRSCHVCRLPMVDDLNRAWHLGIGPTRLLKWLRAFYPDTIVTKHRLTDHFGRRGCAGERADG